MLILKVLKNQNTWKQIEKATKITLMETRVLASMVLLLTWYFMTFYKHSSERLYQENCEMKTVFLIFRVETGLNLVALALA